MHKNFPVLISFIRVVGCYGRGKTKNFQGQGKVGEFCFPAQCIRVSNRPLKAKLNLSECFQPDGVFHFENRASAYFDAAIY